MFFLLLLLLLLTIVNFKNECCLKYSTIVSVKTQNATLLCVCDCNGIYMYMLFPLIFQLNIFIPHNCCTLFILLSIFHYKCTRMIYLRTKNNLIFFTFTCLHVLIHTHTCFDIVGRNQMLITKILKYDRFDDCLRSHHCLLKK